MVGNSAWCGVLRRIFDFPHEFFFFAVFKGVDFAHVQLDDFRFDPLQHFTHGGVYAADVGQRETAALRAHFVDEVHRAGKAVGEVFQLEFKDDLVGRDTGGAQLAVNPFREGFIEQGIGAECNVALQRALLAFVGEDVLDEVLIL